jgi:hypothetical protein
VAPSVIAMNGPVFWQVIAIPVVLFAGLLALVLHRMRHARMPDDVFQDWIEREGHRVISRQFRALLRGPFTWTTRKGQAVFHVILEDELSKQRTAWVRCTMQIDGAPVDAVEVVWLD